MDGFDTVFAARARQQEQQRRQQCVHERGADPIDFWAPPPPSIGAETLTKESEQRTRVSRFVLFSVGQIPSRAHMGIDIKSRTH